MTGRWIMLQERKHAPAAWMLRSVGAWHMPCRLASQRHDSGDCSSRYFRWSDMYQNTFLKQAGVEMNYVLTRITQVEEHSGARLVAPCVMRGFAGQLWPNMNRLICQWAEQLRR